MAASVTGLLEKVKDSNGLLEKINKGLNAYLEKKRLFFPRYVIYNASYKSCYLFVIPLIELQTSVVLFL